MSVNNLQADDWFEISGRGWVAAFKNDPDQIPNINLSDLLGTFVRIDGNVYYVTGIDRQGDSKTDFGLVIRGER